MICQYNDLHLLRLEVKSIEEVCYYENKIFLRQGTSTTELKDMSRITQLIKNYEQGI